MQISLKASLFALLLLAGCSSEKQQVKQQEVPPLNIQTITVKKEKIPIWQRYTGMTKASSDQEVKARVPGILEAIYFHDGDYVTKGQKLFKIEQTEYLAALKAAQAKKQQDEASLALAKADVKRYTPLVEEGLAPRATLEQYQAQEAGLEAAIEADEAQIQKAEIELGYTIIKAPINGRVSARLVDVGNLVGQGESTLLTTIVNTDPLYAYFSPSQADALLFQKYKKKERPDAFIEVPDASNLRLNGYVDFANNSVDALTSTLTMRATIENKERQVLPGTFVYVSLFINDEYEFLMIPPEVVFTDQLGSYVYVVDENSTLKRADIKTGYSSKYYINIESGLKDGDKVAVSALMKLKPNRKVITKDVTKSKGIQAILKQNKLIPEE